MCKNRTQIDKKLYGADTTDELQTLASVRKTQNGFNSDSPPVYDAPYNLSLRMIRTRASSLNPYATSYVPLSRRRATDESTAIDSKIRDEAAWLAYESGSSTQQNQSLRYFKSHDTSAAVPDRSYGSSSHSTELAGKQAVDVDHDMNLAYLQMSFPGVSEGSLFSVYAANRGDMEATVEMLNQLEVHNGKFSENLPDSLDIGDASEVGSSTSSNGGSHKLKREGVNEGSWWT